MKTDGNNANCTRTWDTPIREPWNPIIKHCLNAIDLHVALYLETKDSRHMEQAKLLRGYVSDLKEWIHEAEQHSYNNI